MQGAVSAIFTAPVATWAQQILGKPARAGYLSTGLREQLTDNSTTGDLLKQFRHGLRELGYVEGQNLSIVYQVAEGRIDRLPTLAAELVRLRVEEIVAIGPAALKAARDATTTIPIVAIDYETDPVAAGFAATLAHPRLNVSGIFLDQAELAGKWLELLTYALPSMSRAAVMWDAATPLNQAHAVESAARALKLRLQTIPIRTVDEFDRAFDTAVRGRADAAVVLSSPLFGRHAKEVAGAAMTRRLPTISLFMELAKAGCLFAYGPDQTELYRRLGILAGRILKGAPVAELPIERPVRFHFTINIETAKALSLTIPPSLLARADQVIE